MAKSETRNQEMVLIPRTMKMIPGRRLHYRDNELVRQEKTLIVTRILQTKSESTKGSTLETVRTAERTKVKYERYQYIYIYIFFFLSLWRYEQSSAESSIITFPLALWAIKCWELNHHFFFGVTSNQVLRAQSLLFLWRYEQSSAESSITTFPLTLRAIKCWELSYPFT
jgi:hypothetical protein